MKKLKKTLKNVVSRITNPSISFENGFSMIELLIVIAIVVILFIVLLMSLRTQVSRGRDAERKTDLEKIKVAFEDYYNDNGCYPASDVLEDCGSTDWQYLQSIPCDPITNEPYFYVPASDACAGYRVYTGLEATDDPSIEAAGCDNDDGCGYGSGYNYGISSGVTVYDPDGVPFPTPSPSAPASSPSSNPSPSPTPTSSPLYEYACDNDGVCNRYDHGEAPDSCPMTYLSSNCNNQCGNPANRCDN